MLLSLGSRVRKTPYFQSVLAEGVTRMTVYNHMCLPLSYGDPAAEYDRLINGVALWDVACQRQIVLKGRAAVPFARYLTGRNLDGLGYGRARYAPLCNFRGNLINDPVLLQVDDDEIWLSIADSDVELWAGGLAAGQGWDVAVYEADVAPLAIQGPKARDVARELFGDWVLGLGHFGFRHAEVAGIPLVVSRSGWSRQGGYELYLLDSARGDALWQTVREAGRPYGIGPGAPNPVERLESGLLSYGADTDPQANPFEMGLDRFVDPGQNGDFVGKAALAAILDAGVRRCFVGLLLDGSPLVGGSEHPWPVRRRGRPAGKATAAAYSPRVGSNIAVALVDVEAAESGDPLTVDSGEGLLEARVRSLPFL